MLIINGKSNLLGFEFICNEKHDENKPSLTNSVI